MRKLTAKENTAAQINTGMSRRISGEIGDLTARRLESE
jgi:hypothetical protein